ncbi:FAD:protein FMN transferase [Collinsella tanakaei]|uniref:FAD:protein FMN transferase n=1 Tax=Collinsella tanakaei TaxID=626935 RepID=UPI00248E6CCB|nr:FAD:protein FMN transferase [Collinsella tanakaei]
MVQTYTYGDAKTAMPAWAQDGSRCISFFLFNTQVHMHAYGDAAADPDATARLDAALVAARDRCLFFERAFSRTRDDSDIARAHAASPNAVPVSPQTARLVRQALGYCERSRGKFDITMGTVTSLWNFHTGEVPSRLALARALPHVDYRHIVLDEEPCGREPLDEESLGKDSPVQGSLDDDALNAGTSRAPSSNVPSSKSSQPTLAITDPHTILDLGGVAKGYIADELADLFIAHGVGRFVINLGGNVVVRGGRPADASARPPVAAGSPWRIGIINPLDPAHNRAIVDMADGSVVTSGIHERRFTKGGVTYHHILDPATGMPAKTDLTSATIIAPRSMDCDGYSTTALMLGARDAIDFVESLPGIEAVLIDEADQVWWTSGIEERLSLVPTLPRF